MWTSLKDALLLAILTVILPVGVLPADDSKPVPFGSAPLLNGLLGKIEWEQATPHESGWDNGSIRIIEDSQFVYLCLAPSDTLHTGLDLYVDNTAGEIFMLHVSSAHGQRFLIDSIWQEIDWGPGEHWTSNVVEGIYKNGKTVFMAPEAFEFQIDRQLLPRESFRLMVHLKRPEQWVPGNADTLSSENWLRCTLDHPAGE